MQSKSKRHTLLELKGLGADVWSKINAEDYIRQERDSSYKKQLIAQRRKVRQEKQIVRTKLRVTILVRPVLILST
ncbi:MAG: hypothetical protein PHF56_11230 [Desulfuromonadaceae bacterium]|nr:hypothetical protein [Desulfuromonadaceae bacterium]